MRVQAADMYCRERLCLIEIIVRCEVYDFGRHGIVTVLKR